MNVQLLLLNLSLRLKPEHRVDVCECVSQTNPVQPLGMWCDVSWLFAFSVFKMPREGTSL